MKFQFNSVYDRSDLAAILHATNYLKWASKPNTKRLWQVGRSISPAISGIGAALFLYFTLQKQDPMAMLVGILIFAIGMRIGQRPSATGRSVKYLWRAFDKKEMEFHFGFDEDGMDFHCGSEHEHHEYDQLVVVLEEKKNFFLCFDPRRVSCVLEKKELQQGNVDEFRKFMEEKTGKPVEYFK